MQPQVDTSLFKEMVREYEKVSQTGVSFYQFVAERYVNKGLISHEEFSIYVTAYAMRQVTQTEDVSQF